MAFTLTLLAGMATQVSCLFRSQQRYSDFSTPTPSRERYLILGFMGGREPWNNDKNAVRKLALKLRSDLPNAHVETVENRRRDLALRLVREALDRDGDGSLSPEERKDARVILYGQSFGGAAVVKFARQLEELDVPILLTVQIDSVGRDDGEIPPNVRAAANLYQHDGLIIQGEAPIRAQDPEKTEILGNFEYDYDHREIDISGVSFWKKVLRHAHTKMEFDREVWDKVEELIRQAMADRRAASTASATPARER